MSAYTDVIDEARNRNGRLFKQIQRAVLYYADYSANWDTDETDPDHKKRDWAKSVLLGRLGRSEEYAERLLPLVLGNTDIAAAIVIPVDGNGDPTGPAPGATDALVQQIVELNLPTIWAG